MNSQNIGLLVLGLVAVCWGWPGCSTPTSPAPPAPAGLSSKNPSPGISAKARDLKDLIDMLVEIEAENEERRVVLVMLEAIPDEEHKDHSRKTEESLLRAAEGLRDSLHRETALSGKLRSYVDRKKSGGS